MSEADLLVEIRRSLLDQYPGIFYHKLADPNPRFRKLNRFNPPRPFDSLAVRDGVPYAIEAKLWRDGTSFNFSRVTEEEYDNLRDFSLAQGIAYIALGIRNTKHRKLYMVPLEDWNRLRQTMESQGRKSIPLGSLFLLEPYECQWLKHGKWQINLK